MLDYHIDRPRVVGLRSVPPVVTGGEVVRIEALGVVPLGDEVAALTARTCAPDELARTVYLDLACVEEPELVVDLGAVPLSWTVPLVAGCDVQDTTMPCSSTLPMVVTVRGSDGREGHGHVFLAADRDPPPVKQVLSEAVQELTVEGEVRAGGEVELVHRIEGATMPTVRWLVDAGELIGTGETASIAYEDGFSVSTNRLRIPDDWHGPLRVVTAVGHAPTWGGADGAWTTITLEVP